MTQAWSTREKNAAGRFHRVKKIAEVRHGATLSWDVVMIYRVFAHLKVYLRVHYRVLPSRPCGNPLARLEIGYRNRDIPVVLWPFGEEKRRDALALPRGVIKTITLLKAHFTICKKK